MYDWSYFDKIYCVSTPEASSRRLSCKSLCKKLNMSVDIKIFPRHPEGSNRGCFESHISIIKDAHQHKYDRIIILEDDIIEGNVNPKIVDKIIQFLKANNWDLFYFGAVPDCRRDNACVKHPKYKNFYRIKSLCTHAYAINKNAIKQFHDLNYIDLPIDYMYRDNNEIISYAYISTQFFQETGCNAPQFVINNYFRLVETYAYNIGVNIYHPVYKILFLLLFTVILYKICKHHSF